MIVTASGCKVDWYEYFNKFGFVPYIRKRGRTNRIKCEVLNLMCAFDIETSTVWLNPDKKLYDVHSFMYVWQMQIEEYTIKGRTWEEFFSFLNELKNAINRIKEDNNLSESPLLVFYVHNLAYEWTFLSGVYKFRNDECFFRDVRKPIYCRMFDVFEFRCSYIQTNLSLSALCKQTGVEEKLSGEKYDYDKIRFPWTRLTEYEEEYTTRDVKSLVEAMRYRIQKGGDDLITVPLTSTGYVRRECKEALKPLYMQIRSLKPDLEQYKLLRECFRGGNSHANMQYVGKILEGVESYDINSSYPSQQLMFKFPMKKFSWLDLEELTQSQRMESVLTYLGLGYAVVGRYYFTNIRLKNKKEPIPYISLSKCDAIGFKLDNGRILEAETLKTACTEIDLNIILNQYEFDNIGVSQCMVAEKDYLPEEYRNVIMNYYQKKTILKGDDTEDGKYMYMKSKNMLNSIY